MGYVGMHMMGRLRVLQGVSTGTDHWRSHECGSMCTFQFRTDSCSFLS